jgi:uncharacterized protein (DUF2062 family)
VPKRLYRYLPTPEAILAKRWCAPFRPVLGHPSLWHFNRRSVPGAMAIGLFCGLIPGPFQMLSALIVSIPLRQNIPLALAVTFYTNPLTIVPIYVVAYGYGRLLVRDDGEPHNLVPDAWNPTGIWDWMLDLGKPLGIGLIALAVTLAVAGYFGTRLAWRMQVVRAWRRRALERKGGLRAARTPVPPAPQGPDRG